MTDPRTPGVPLSVRGRRGQYRDTPRKAPCAQRREAMVELFAVRRQLAGVATNVNQMARRVNAGEGFGDDAAETLASVRVVTERIDRAIDGLGAS